MNNPAQSNYAPTPPTNTLAIVSLVSGILGWVLETAGLILSSDFVTSLLSN